jgi:hypothetical protein
MYWFLLKTGRAIKKLEPGDNSWGVHFHGLEYGGNPSAGLIYEYIVLETRLGPKTFKHTVIRYYQSIDSPRGMWLNSRGGGGSWYSQDTWIRKFWSIWRLHVIKRRNARRIITRFVFNHVLPYLYNPDKNGIIVQRLQKEFDVLVLAINSSEIKKLP